METRVSAAGFEIEHEDGEQAIGEVRGKLEVVLVGLVLAVLGDDRGNSAAGDVDALIERLRERWAALRVMVADELKVAARGEDGGLIVDGAVNKMISEVNVDAGAVYDLYQIAGGEGMAVETF